MSTARALHIIFFLAGLALGSLATTLITSPSMSTMADILVEERAQGKKYTSPLLECSSSEPLPPQQFTALRVSINSIRETYADKGAAASVYIRDLSNGGSVSFHEAGQEYDAASLMKLPVYIALMKKAELKPEILQIKLKAYEDEVVSQNIISHKPTKPGELLTIAELMRRSATYSDNRATNTLLEYIGIDSFNEVLQDHDLPSASLGEIYQVTPLDYSAFFRVLYNATYVSLESSEKILEMLTKAEFDDGIRSGVPKSIPIANKFGEQVIENEFGRSFELHDCGIVYAKRPYVMCVMTKGDSFETLYGLIRELSSKTYEIMSK